MLPIRYWPSLIEPVGRDREVAERQPFLGLELHLLRGNRHVGGEPLDHRVGRVAHLADVEILDVGIHLRRCRHGGPAERHRLASRLGARMDIADLRSLDVHAADHHRVGPGEILRLGACDVLVDEADRPVLGQIGRQHQQALRRHERLDVVEQGKGVREGAERRGVGRKHAEDFAGGRGLDRTTQAEHSVLSRREWNEFCESSTTCLKSQELPGFRAGLIGPCDGRSAPQ